MAMSASSVLETVFRKRKKNPIEFKSIFKFNFDTIRAATDDFSCLIDHGGLYSVYKGRLKSGQEIAVRILSGNSQVAEKEFHNEVNLLSKLWHKNVIDLLGFCSKRDQHVLVYEFMPNLSLHHFIFDPTRASELSWEMCRNIIEGVACGLRYLNEESGLWVVHRGIKPENILLDSEMKPKITGFGPARILQQGQTIAESDVGVSTVDLDPDYIRTGRISFKSDVYCLGGTILTIISRRRLNRGDEETLIEYVMRCWERGEPIQVIHEVMREGDSISEILRYIQIALLCIDENADTRPSLENVLHWFSCISTPLPEPTFDNPFGAEELPFSPSLSSGNSSNMSPISSDDGSNFELGLGKLSKPDNPNPKNGFGSGSDLVK